MKPIIYIFLLIFFIQTNSIFAQRVNAQRVEDLTGDQKIKEGVFYALPKTIVQVDLKIYKTVKITPVYPLAISDIFPQVMIDNNLIQQIEKDEITFTAGDLAISTFARPDLDEVFKVEIKKKWNKKRSIDLTLDQAGIIQNVISESEDLTYEFISNTISTLATLSGAAKAKAKKTTDGTDLEDAINQLHAYQDTRFELLKSPKNGEVAALNKQLEEIDKLINNHLQIYFIGITRKKEFGTCRFKFDLKKAEDKDNKPSIISFLKIHDQKGIKLLSTTEYEYEGMQSNEDAKNGQTTYALSFINIENFSNTLSGFSKSESQTKKGMYYRIPGKIAVTIQVNENPVKKKEIHIAQFGEVINLPYKLDGMTIAFFGDLGSIKQFKGNTSPVNSKGISDITNQLVELEKLNDPESELSKLNNENSVLEAKKKNKDLKTELGLNPN